MGPVGPVFYCIGGTFPLFHNNIKLRLRTPDIFQALSASLSAESTVSGFFFLHVVPDCNYRDNNPPNTENTSQGNPDSSRNLGKSEIFKKRRLFRRCLRFDLFGRTGWIADFFLFGRNGFHRDMFAVHRGHCVQHIIVLAGFDTFDSQVGRTDGPIIISVLNLCDSIFRIVFSKIIV